MRGGKCSAPTPEHGARIRVKFDQTVPIANSSFRKSWFTIPHTCDTVSDLLVAMQSAFSITGSVASLQLFVSGYAVLPSEKISLFLRPEDILDVRQSIRYEACLIVADGQTPNPAMIEASPAVHIDRKPTSTAIVLKEDTPGPAPASASKRQRKKRSSRGNDAIAKELEQHPTEVMASAPTPEKVPDFSDAPVVADTPTHSKARKHATVEKESPEEIDGVSHTDATPAVAVRKLKHIRFDDSEYSRAGSSRRENRPDAIVPMNDTPSSASSNKTPHGQARAPQASKAPSWIQARLSTNTDTVQQAVVAEDPQISIPKIREEPSPSNSRASSASARDDWTPHSGTAADDADADYDACMMGQEYRVHDARKNPYSIISSVHNRGHPSMDTADPYADCLSVPPDIKLQVGDIISFRQIELCTETWAVKTSAQAKATVSKVLASGEGGNSKKWTLQLDLENFIDQEAFGSACILVDNDSLTEVKIISGPTINIIENLSASSTANNSAATSSVLDLFQNELSSKRRRLR